MPPQSATTYLYLSSNPATQLLFGQTPYGGGDYTGVLLLPVPGERPFPVLVPPTLTQGGISAVGTVGLGRPFPVPIVPPL